MGKSLTEVLAQSVGRSVDDRTRRRVALHVLDWIGCAALGSTAPAGRALADYGTGQPSGDATAFGADRRDATTAAFVNGGLGNIYEMDDLHRTSIVHAGDIVVPAALAAAQRDGAEAHGLLDAVVRGYEAAIRIGIAAGPGHYEHWYNTATCGVFGAAAAAASLHALDPAETVDALAQAGIQAAGLWQCRMEPGHSKQLATARAAQSGLIAGDLARTGFPGPRRVLEGEHGFFAAMCASNPSRGPRPEAITAAPENGWMVFETSFKPWPACRHSHPVIEAALALRDPAKNAGIAGVSIETYEQAVAFCDDPAPASAHEGRFSLQHCTATTLLNGVPSLPDFMPEAIAERAVADLRTRVSVQADPKFSAAFPKHYGARLAVSYEDGTVREHEVSTAKGDPENPMTEAEIVDKARSLLSEAGVDQDAIESAVTAVLSLPDGGALAPLSAALAGINLHLADAKPRTDA